MSRRIEGIIVHWSASGPNTTVADIRRWHKSRGFRDIGYHRVIVHPHTENQATEPGHLIKEGRDLDTDLFIKGNEVGAHALGYNRDTVGVCVVGGPGWDLHDLQRKALIEALEILTERFELPRSKVLGHREVNATACPGLEILGIIKEWRDWRHQEKEEYTHV